MSRKSRRPAPPPSPQQLAKWRKFVGVALEQARAPLEPLGLSGLAHSLSKTPLPVNERTTSGPLYRLLQLAKPFESFMPERRLREAVQMRRLAEACVRSVGAVVEAKPPAGEERPEPRLRVDVYG